MAYLITERRSGLTFGMPPLPDGMPFRSCSDAIREPLRGGTARVTDIVALRVRPALYAGHGSYGRGSGSGYRYQAQPLHCGEQVADFFPPCVPFLREARFPKTGTVRPATPAACGTNRPCREPIASVRAGHKRARGCRRCCRRCLSLCRSAIRLPPRQGGSGLSGIPAAF